MSSLNVYYDGTNFVPLEKVNLKPNQKLSITIHNQKYDKKNLKQKSYFGVLKGQFTLASDFDAPLTDFQEYM